jgi:tetratricopeptide (TPR) repeat protein
VLVVRLRAGRVLPKWSPGVRHHITIGAVDPDDRGDLSTRGALAYLLETRGRPEEAEQLWHDAIDQGAPGASSWLGRMLERLGRYEEAEHVWREAMAQAVTSPAPTSQGCWRGSADTRRLTRSRGKAYSRSTTAPAPEAQPGRYAGHDAIARRRWSARCGRACPCYVILRIVDCVR